MHFCFSMYTHLWKVFEQIRPGNSKGMFVNLYPKSPLFVNVIPCVQGRFVITFVQSNKRNSSLDSSGNHMDVKPLGQ